VLVRLTSALLLRAALPIGYLLKFSAAFSTVNEYRSLEAAT
jgi:hypothetical protein